MAVTKQGPVCKTPELCVIACPFNRVLTELGEPTCEPPQPLNDGEDCTLEIVFGDAKIADVKD